MQEEYRKKFVLLSKVAKEKKYAQEYLGLLARRGDIGSIRIGKRWYTTEEWVGEFEKDKAQAKETFSNEANAALPLVVSKKQSVDAAEDGTAFIAPAIFPTGQVIREYHPPFATGRRENFIRGEAHPGRIVSSARIRMQTAGPARNMSADILKIGNKEKIKIYGAGMNRAQRQPDFQNIAQEKMRKAVQGAVSVRKSTKNLSTSLAEKQRGTENFLPRFDQYQNIVSPNFSLDSEKAAVRHERISGFSNFGTGLAFGFAMMLLLVLVFQLGWLFSDDIREMAGLHRGIVAGASDERIKNASFSETSASGYIATQTAEAKEIISLSRVLLKAAMERDSEQGSTSSEAPRSDIGGHGADNDQ